MKILTHNVYWFQGHPSRWGDERVAEVPTVFDALCDLYAAAQADVICLQEVHRADLVATLAARLGMAAHLHAFGGVMRDYGGAMLCRTPATLTDHTHADPAHPHQRVHMRGVMQCDDGSLTLTLAMLHLPSNRFVADAAAGEAGRVAELQQTLAIKPMPDVVLGDMNSLPGSGPYQLLAAMGYRDAAVLMNTDTQRKRRIDYIWVHPSLADRVVAFEALDRGVFDQGGYRLSDHPPLLLTLA